LKKANHLPHPASRTPHAVVFLFLLALGAMLRFQSLDRQSLWDDEMSTRKVMVMPVAIWPAYFHVYEMHPPLYFYQLRGWEALFGDSLKAQRANSALWGTLALALIFFLMRMYRGPAPGLLAMALMTLSPYHLAYSQEMRPYSMAIALGILGYLVLEAALRERRGWGMWLLLSVVMTAELYTHYWGSYVVASQLIYGGWSSSSRSQRIALVSTGAAAGILFLFWTPVLVSQLRYIKELSFWVPRASPATLAQSVVAFTGVYFRYASRLFVMPGSFPLAVGVALLNAGVIAYGGRRAPKAAGVWLLAGLGLPFGVSFCTQSPFVWYRYPSLIFPAFVILQASCLHSLPSRRWRNVAISILLIAGSASCYAYLNTWEKANPKSVMTYIHQSRRPGSVVIRPAYFAPLFAYYAPGAAGVIDQDKLDSVERRAALRGKDILFIAFDVPEDPVREALLSEFKVVSVKTFPGYAHLGITVYRLR
jgi:mannosyltransferase